MSLTLEFSANKTKQGDNYLTIGLANLDLVSSDTKDIFEVVNYVFISCLIGLFGIVTNAINMVVFCRQGFKNTMTISFMALAISDMVSLVTIQWFCVCANPLLMKTNIYFVPGEIRTLTGEWFHFTFSRITSWITAYVTAERCLCITAPLSVRNIITPKRTTVSLAIIYVINLLVLVPEYTTSYIGWKFYPDRNVTLIGVIISSDNEKAEGVVFLLHSVLVLTSFVCVTVLTSVLVIKLKGASQWRRQAAQGKAQSQDMSKKDKKATRMVAMISGLLIATNTPGVTFSIVSVFEPKFGIYGSYQNLFLAAWSFGFTCDAINSSVNIFMYYSMSSKYREIFNHIFLKGNNKRKQSLP